MILWVSIKVLLEHINSNLILLWKESGSYYDLLNSYKVVVYRVKNHFFSGSYTVYIKNIKEMKWLLPFWNEILNFLLCFNFFRFRCTLQQKHFLNNQYLLKIEREVPRFITTSKEFHYFITRIGRKILFLGLEWIVS